MNISSRSKLLKESEKTLIAIRKKIKEAMAPDELALKIEQFGELSDEIDKVETHLKQLKTQYNDLNSILLPVMEELKELGQNAMETKKYLLTIKRAAYERSTASYKSAFDLALTKVNQKIKDILNDALESTKTVSKVSASLGVQRIGEGSFFGSIMDKIKSLFIALKSKIKNTNNEVKNLKAMAKKIQ
jgi:hypothetical protein